MKIIYEKGRKKTATAAGRLRDQKDRRGSLWSVTVI